MQYSTETLSSPRGEWQRLAPWCHCVYLHSDQVLNKESDAGDDGSFLAIIYFTHTYNFSDELVLTIVDDPLWEEHAINFGW